MTILLINKDKTILSASLTLWINKLLNTSYSSISQIYSNPDIHILENPPRVSIKIEEVKQLQKEMVYKPFESDNQIAVIFHSENLTTEAQNALLKTLEEQSDSTHYILLVDNERNLLPTILSRSKKYYPTISGDTKNLKTEVEVSESTFISNNIVETFAFIEKIVDEEKESKGIIDSHLQELEKLLNINLEKAVYEKDYKNIKKYLSKINSLLTAKTRLKMNVNKKLLLENLVVQINE